MSVLQTIQQLQFTDKSAAEQLLLRFLRETSPFNVISVRLRPLAVSLNSFNGFMTLDDGRELFFKTHTETDTIIDEYYHADLLAQAGYPIVQPLYASQETGKQILIYEAIDDPSVFDVAWTIEQGDETLLAVLTRAQQEADDALLDIYLNTLAEQTAEQAAKAPIHQLFYHRLAGGRLARFYGGPSTPVDLTLPGGTFSVQQVRAVRWTINDQIYEMTLEDLIEKAMRLLEPAQAGPSIIGHGDAHNGNVFFRQASNSLVYFDPAFAGRHHPLLDLAKPLFHNVFAMWMYFPHEKAEALQISFRPEGLHWRVTHNYSLHPVRLLFLESKLVRVLVPLLRELAARNWLRLDWRDYLKAALFCCPLLTMNLADTNKFSPEISLLGLTMSIEMGAESTGARSIIDSVLDQVQALLSQQG
ncbi:MAG: phosphotransferase [Aggregatilineales bacterium]